MTLIFYVYLLRMCCVLKMACSWPSGPAFFEGKLLTSNPAVERASAFVPKSRTQSQIAKSSLKFVTADPTDGPSPAQQLILAREATEIAKMRDFLELMIAAGNPNEGIRALDEWSKTHPVGRHLLIPLLIDSYFAAGRVDEAYQRAVAHSDHWMSIEMWHRLALACALKGQVYEGQIEYCRQDLEYEMPGAGEYFDVAPSTENAIVIAAIACAHYNTVGYESRAIMFYKIAEKAEPTNPYVQFLLGRKYGTLGQFALAKQSYVKALVKAHGVLREELFESLRLLKERMLVDSFSLHF